MRCSEFLYPESIARCQHIKVNGVQCGSPSLKHRKFCYFHQQWQQRRIEINANRARRSRFSLDLPLLEDANSIQVALMQVMRLLLTNQIDHRTAALLFYALQTASSNLRATSFEPKPQQVVIDPRGVSETGLGDEAWYKEEFDDDAEDSEEEGEQQEEDGEDESGGSEETADIEAAASRVNFKANLKACAAPPSVRIPRKPAARFLVQNAHKPPKIAAGQRSSSATTLLRKMPGT